MSRVILLVLCTGAILGGALLLQSTAVPGRTEPNEAESHQPTDSKAYASRLSDVQKKILAGAKSQLENPASYSGAYYKISYPNGDPPADRGACTDVVVRALRHAGFDLQQLIHEDSKVNNYPRIQSRDSNIDHRRCPNQSRFFARHGLTLTLNPQMRSEWQPGDIVFWKLDNQLDHVGVLSDKISRSGDLLVVHNIGPHVKEEDVLRSWKIVGHFRFPPPPIAPSP